MEENTDLYIETQHLSQLLIFKALQNLKFEISKVFEDIRIRQNYAVNVKFLSEKNFLSPYSADIKTNNKR